jgi:hypothetical protein
LRCEMILLILKNISGKNVEVGSAAVREVEISEEDSLKKTFKWFSSIYEKRFL